MAQKKKPALSKDVRLWSFTWVDPGAGEIWVNLRGSGPVQVLNLVSSLPSSVGVSLSLSVWQTLSLRCAPAAILMKSMCEKQSSDRVGDGGPHRHSRGLTFDSPISKIISDLSGGSGRCGDVLLYLLGYCLASLCSLHAEAASRFVNDSQQIAMSHSCALKVHRFVSPFAKLLRYIWFLFQVSSRVHLLPLCVKVERQK